MLTFNFLLVCSVFYFQVLSSAQLELKVEKIAFDPKNVSLIRVACLSDTEHNDFVFRDKDGELFDFSKPDNYRKDLVVCQKNVTNSIWLISRDKKTGWDRLRCSAKKGTINSETRRIFATSDLMLKVTVFDQDQDVPEYRPALEVKCTFGIMPQKDYQVDGVIEFRPRRRPDEAVRVAAYSYNEDEVNKQLGTFALVDAFGVMKVTVPQDSTNKQFKFIAEEQTQPKSPSLEGQFQCILTVKSAFDDTQQEQFVSNIFDTTTLLGGKQDPTTEVTPTDETSTQQHETNTESSGSRVAKQTFYPILSVLVLFLVRCHAF